MRYLIAFVAVFALASCAPTEPATDSDPAPVERQEPDPADPATYADLPGSAEVYVEIATTKNCAALQETFDRAAANNDRAEVGSDAFEYTTAYMTAADERMREVGCYE